jgi:hypothetical protein
MPPNSDGPVSRPDGPLPDGLPPTSDGSVSRPDEPAPGGPVCYPDDDVADPTGATTGPTSWLAPTSLSEPAMTADADDGAALYADVGGTSSPGYGAADATYPDSDGDTYDLPMDA